MLRCSRVRAGPFLQTRRWRPELAPRGEVEHRAGALRGHPRAWGCEQQGRARGAAGSGCTPAKQPAPASACASPTIAALSAGLLQPPTWP